MTGFFFFRKRNIYWLRLCSFFLAVLFFLGAASLPLNAAKAGYNAVNVDSDSQAGTTAAAEETTETTQMPVMDTTSQASLIVGTGRGMVLYHNHDNTAANYPAASKLMTAVIALEALTLDTQVWTRLNQNVSESLHSIFLSDLVDDYRVQQSGEGMYYI